MDSPKLCLKNRTPEILSGCLRKTNIELLILHFSLALNKNNKTQANKQNNLTGVNPGMHTLYKSLYSRNKSRESNFFSFFFFFPLFPETDIRTFDTAWVLKMHQVQSLLI